MDASSLMGLFAAAWDRRKKNKRDRGTAVVGISDDGTLIYEVQCKACDSKIGVYPRSDSTSSFIWGNFDKHSC